VKSKVRWWTIGLGLVAAIVLVPAASAWACLGLAGLTASPTAAQPGSTIQLKGVEFGSNPVQIHLDGLNGPVLATIAPTSGIFTQSLTLPADLSNGPHVLVATESAVTANGLNNGAANGTPARALIQVGPATASAASPAPLANLTQSSSSSGVGTFVLIALGVAGGSLFLAAGGIFLAGAFSRRRRAEGEAVIG